MKIECFECFQVIHGTILAVHIFNNNSTEEFKFVSTITITCYFLSLYLQPGESGFVVLGDLTLETSTDPDDSWAMGPPSPCDVEFANANIVINGKSSMRNKTSRDSKVSVSNGRLFVQPRYTQHNRKLFRLIHGLKLESKS